MEIDVPPCFRSVNWLTPHSCEEKALSCLRALGTEPQFPIDVEHLVEISSQLQVDYVGDDFFDQHGGEVLGMFDFATDTVYINQVRNAVEVRLRWTLAHEFGHFVLHGPYYRAGQQSLFDNEPTHLLYRATTSVVSKLEKQANMFAEAILMPEHLVRDLAERLQTSSPLLDSTLIESLRTSAKVSRESARIRLLNLKII